MKEKSIVGDLINFRGLVYSPINEQGVVFLFGKVIEDLNMYIEEIKPGFPDCIGRRFTGKGWERVSMEFEFKSSNFQIHGHNPDQCDLIVCWEHDWPDCPLEVIELKEVIKTLPTEPIERPDEVKTETGKASIEDHLGKVPEKVRALLDSLDESIRGISDGIWRKVAVFPFVTYYSPERVFVYVELQKKGLKLSLFTKGESLAGVEAFDYEKGGAKWGKIYVRDEKDLLEVKPVLEKSYSLIQQAIRNNEPTGWYATIEQEAEESSDN